MTGVAVWSERLAVTATSLALVLVAVSGCGVVRFTTRTSGGATSGAGQSTESGGANLGGFVALYEEAVQAATGPIADTTALAAARKKVRSCGDMSSIADRYGEQTSETSKGPKTVRAMAGDCAELGRELSTRKVKGCGSRPVVIVSDALQGGRWTPIQVAVPNTRFTGQPMTAWTPIACDRVRENPAPNRDFAGLKPKVLAVCGQPGAVAWLPHEWTYEKNELGTVTSRFAMAEWRADGEISGWDRAP